MHMVIFGAGASYDSDASHTPPTSNERRPPLSDSLFGQMAPHETALRDYPELRPILHYLRHRSVGISVEEMLERLQAEAKDDPGRVPQIAAVRFYLQHLITTFERDWVSVHHGATNYVSLLDQLRRRLVANEPTLLVTFNYDTMIERALSSVRVNISQIGDYITSPNFKLIKLHGSVNWARIVERPKMDLSKNPHDVARELIARFAELTISDDWRIVEGLPSTKVGTAAAVPALSIPVQAKSTFECPSEHLETLTRHLPNITKILIVGWKGAEAHFAKLLSEHLRREVEAMVVAETEDAAAVTATRLHDIAAITAVTRVGGGFSEFTVNRKAEEFFGSSK